MFWHSHNHLVKNTFWYPFLHLLWAMTNVKVCKYSIRNIYLCSYLFLILFIIYIPPNFQRALLPFWLSSLLFTEVYTCWWLILLILICSETKIVGFFRFNIHKKWYPSQNVPKDHVLHTIKYFQNHKQMLLQLNEKHTLLKFYQTSHEVIWLHSR